MTTTAIKPSKQHESTPDVPEWLARECERDAALAVPWSLDLKYQKHLVIEHESYQRWIDETFPDTTSLPTFAPTTGLATAFHKGLKIGSCSYVRVHNPTLVYGDDVSYIGPIPIVRSPRWKRQPWPLLRYGREVGNAYTTGSILLPILLRAGRYSDPPSPWMSPTPSEVMSQRPGLRAARGRVFVGGLGMGWFAREVARKKGVKSVVVAELDPDIANYFGENLRDVPNISIVVADAYDAAASEYDSVLFDIWPSANDAAWCSRWQKFKADLTARGVRAWGWGDYKLRG